MGGGSSQGDAAEQFWLAGVNQAWQEAEGKQEECLQEQHGYDKLLI